MERLDNWLLESDIVAKTGKDKGGVAGGLMPGNSPNYYYGEICGYYLSYLAGLGAAGRILGNRLYKAASSTIIWMRGQWQRDCPPQTRVSPHENTEDWRNDLIFSFDLSMMVRGLFLCLELMPELASVWEGRELVAKLLEMRDTDGYILPVKERIGARQNQRKTWSVQRGAYQLKVASALNISSKLPGASPLAATALVMANQWMEKEAEFLETFQGPPHPALYAVEGALALSRQTGKQKLADMARKGFERLLQRYSNNNDDSFTRSDVIGQLIRAGILLNHSIPFIGKSLIPELIGFIHSEGGVLFRKNVSQKELVQNSWCTMFSRQALAWWSGKRDVFSSPDSYLKYLI